MRTLLWLVLFLLFCFVCLPVTIETVKAESTIYIRADGSVEGTDRIQRDEFLNRFIFLGDIVNQSIVVERNLVTLEGAGFSVQGNGTEAGIKLVGGGTVKNVSVSCFGVGVFFEGNNKAVVSGCNLTENDTGIVYKRKDYKISNSLITGNNITGNRVGISINMGNKGSETGLIVVGNHISKNEVAMYFSLMLSYVVDASRPYPMNVRIHHNSFVDNNQTTDYGFYEIPAFPVYVSRYSNLWDNAAEGNYWSNYNGTDNDGDNIGDEPHVIDFYNKDNYPLVTPVPTQMIPEFSSLTHVLVVLFSVVDVTVVYTQKKSSCLSLHTASDS